MWATLDIRGGEKGLQTSIKKNYIYINIEWNLNGSIWRETQGDSHKKEEEL